MYNSLYMVCYHTSCRNAGGMFELISRFVGSLLLLHKACDGGVSLDVFSLSTLAGIVEGCGVFVASHVLSPRRCGHTA